MSRVLDQDGVVVADGLGDLVESLRGRRVLVTGATGLLGRSLVDALLTISARLDDELHVVALARNADKARTAFGVRESRSALSVVIGDVADPSALPDDVDLIVHAASPATPRMFRADPVGVVRANVLGAHAVLELARHNGAYVSFISTMEIYGEVARPDGQADLFLVESDRGVLDSMDLRSAYPESKRVAENLCVAYAAQYGVRSDVVRLSHTYGPGMDPSDDRVQADFLRKALSGQDVVLKSDGSMTRTYTYVADAVSAILRIALTADRRTVPTPFNVADEASRVSIKQLALTVLDAAGREPESLQIDLSGAGQQLWSTVRGGTYLDCTRLRDLGWRAQFSLAEGMRRTVEHDRSAAAEPGTPA